MAENDEQAAVIAWAEYMSAVHPCLKWLFHVPNGGSRNKAEAYRMKETGIKSGVADLVLPYPNKDYHGLFIEMKRAEKSKSRVSDSQKDFLSYVNSVGYLGVVCYGADQAISTIESYINNV